ncbi:MAG: uroporphyrinogen-III C-methyltransferase [Hirschia sp.]|nr:uroporphyrinogen-III C-methyltransferase [Hirschia sp.]MBF18597.1 uroporphyrinogen-III C-methyltransferase [Hirschia sp.]
MSVSAISGKGAKAGFTPGSVCLVGAGPGDPELLTLKAVNRMAQAEIVFCDRLVADDIRAFINPDARQVYVGKSKGEHSVPQEEIHERLIAAARSGKRVMRLKGGDPFIFGRGGEEVEALRLAGISTEVIPGITSALGCAASQEIPLTHRGLAQAVTFVTGHARLGEAPDLDWAALARGNQTVVVFMGVGAAPMIADRLIAAGRAADAPVAAIENGTRADEKTVHGTLGDLATLLADNDITGPALLIIGEVATLGKGALKNIIQEAQA